MLSGAALRKTAEGWEFASEAALENFVWANLESLLGLTPLKRQYPVLGEICDILAVNSDKQLVVLELKNAEDRYIVQQLTRYYENILETKPFLEDLDYNKPIKLVALAPNFHRYNLVDRKYTKLDISFVSFQVVENDSRFDFCLKDVDNEGIFQIPIPYTKVELVSKEDLPAPPKLLLDWLGSCTGDEQEGIIKMREKILLFDKRMQEMIDTKKSISYGRGKTKTCAELCWERKLQKPVLFLRLPIPNVWREQKNLGRMRIWTDGKTVSYVGHVPEGFGIMKPMVEWEKIPHNEWPKSFSMGMSYNSKTPLDCATYLRIVEYREDSTSLEALVEIALEKWRQR